MSLRSVSIARKLGSSNNVDRHKNMLRHRRALFKKLMNKVFLKMGNEVFSQAININSLPISTPKDLMCSLAFYSV